MSPPRAFALVSLVLFGGLGLGKALADQLQARSRAPYAGLDTLARGLITIEQRHVDAVSREALLYGAMRGMVGELDEHSLFFDPETHGGFIARTERAAEAIGVDLEAGPRGARISRVVPRGPAALAGLLVGDTLVSVDGSSVIGLPRDEAMTLLQGERGTPVALELLREGAALRVVVVRDAVIEVAVDGELPAPGLAVVHLRNFRRRVGADTARLLSELAQKGGGPLTGVLLDLRGNPGGLMDEAVAVLDLFLPAGDLIQTRGRGGVVTATDRSTDSPSDFQGRVVVLIDGGSASASEVVAGALQDLKRATLVGSRSYGKGSVQETRTFEDGSAFKLTVARYHLPSGRAIADHEGLVPDVGVPRPRVESPAVVALRAELAGIATTDEQRARVEAQLTALSAEAAEVDPPRGGAFAERLAADPQLAAAWDRLRAGP